MFRLYLLRNNETTGERKRPLHYRSIPGIYRKEKEGENPHQEGVCVPQSDKKKCTAITHTSRVSCVEGSINKAYLRLQARNHGDY